MSTTLDITGMTCAACAARIEKKLNRTTGVEAVVNYATERATLELGGDAPSVDELIRTVESMGYGASLPAVTAVEATAAGRSEADRWRRRAAVSIGLGVPVVVLSMVTAWQFRNWQWLCFALALPVATWGAWPFHRAAWKNLRQGEATMDTLVSVGVIAAFGWSAWALFFTDAGDSGMTMTMSVFGHGSHSSVPHLYLEVASTIVGLLVLGRWFEHRSRREGRGALTALAGMSASHASVLRDGSEHRVAVEDLVVGDIYVLRPGDRLPADGTVSAGTSAIDASLVTGESAPVEVRPGDQVLAGTINVSGRLEVRTTSRGSESALARLAALLEEAQSGKAQVQRLADRVAAVFVPIVIALAMGTLGFWLGRTGSWSDAIRPAIATLIVACPCALGLATPMALLIGSGRGAQLGLIVRGPAALEAAKRIDTIVLDKTGTVTTGVMTVVEVDPIGDVSQAELLALAGAAEGGSEHPIGRAIVRAAASNGPIRAAEHFVAIGGVGVEASVGGRHVVVRAPVGDERPGDPLGQEGLTVVAVVVDGAVQGYIGIADALKPASAAAVADLVALGLRPVLLTGDNEAVARSVALSVGITDVRSGVRPDGKVAAVRALQADGRTVAMVGDGVNDAAALSTADLGIAMGTGTDVAQEAADLTIVNGELTGAVTGILLARRTLGTIKGNLFWAFAYNVVMIPLAMIDRLSPALAGVAMACSSAFVVANSLRLRRFDRKR